MSIRQKIRIHNGWKFYLGDITTPNIKWDYTKAGVCQDGGARRRMDDSNWQNITLPHDYMVEGSIIEKKHTIHQQLNPINYPERHNFRDNNALYECSGSYARDIGWYRYHFTPENVNEESRTYLWFEGIYRDSQIYLNDCFVGSHASGYTPIILDITDAIYPGQDNVLAVRVNPTEQEGWWYEGSGIYRNAWMLTVNNLHLRPQGTFIWADEFSKDYSSCTVHVRSSLRNKNKTQRKAVLSITLKDPVGNTAGQISMQGNVSAYGEAVWEGFVRVEKPFLWDIKTPQLYTAVLQVMSDGKTVDEETISFGIREAKFDPNQGFLLNGRSVKLNGTCCHQDHAGVGTAIPYGLDEYRIDKLLALGSNALRTSHNPPSEQLMEICDKKGMLVMAENRLLCSAPDNIQQLTDLIETHRNHPSVILWSIANEEEFVQWEPIAAKLARTLVQTAKTLDHTRPVTAAIPLVSWLNHYVTEPVETVLPYSDELDVMGFNYSTSQWLRFHDIRPNQPIVISEDMGGDLTRGCYEKDPSQGHYYNGLEQYEELSRRIAIVDGNAFISGVFLWTGFAYRGEPTGPSPAVVADFGLLDLCGFPKDTAYFYQSVWSQEPYIKITPTNWNRPGDNGKEIPVIVFSNCPLVELYLNGKKIGTKQLEPYQFAVWNLPYEAGQLKAVGKKENQLCEDIVETTEAPFRIQTDIQRYSDEGTEWDTVICDCYIVDQNGKTVPYANNYLRFSAEEDAVFLGCGNGNPSDYQNDKLPGRCAFHGCCQAIYKVPKNAHPSITVRSEGLFEATSCL